jgi:soluble lytic murein transglycosylase
MRIKTWNQISVIFALVLTAGLYQNFNVAKMWSLPVAEIDEIIRSSHARELLGKGYFDSLVIKAEGLSALHMAIYTEVHNSLPKKFKKRSLQVASAIIEESEKNGLDPVFVLAVIKTESSFNPLAKGSIGEIGLMQLRPCTAEWIAAKGKIPFRGKRTLENPVENVRIGTFYFKYLRNKFGGEAFKYLAAYNMGAANVRRMIAEDKKPREYSMRVMKNYRLTYQRLIASSGVVLIAQN